VSSSAQRFSRCLLQQGCFTFSTQSSGSSCRVLFPNFPMVSILLQVSWHLIFEYFLDTNLSLKLVNGVSGVYGRRDCANITLFLIERTCLCEHRAHVFTCKSTFRVFFLRPRSFRRPRSFPRSLSIAFAGGARPSWSSARGPGSCSGGRRPGAW
jgi:hypothetical protein